MSGFSFGTDNQEEKETKDSSAFSRTTPTGNPLFGDASPNAAPVSGSCSFGETMATKKISTTSVAAGLSCGFGGPAAEGGSAQEQEGAFGAKPVATIGGIGAPSAAYFKSKFTPNPNLIVHFSKSVKQKDEGIARNRYNHHNCNRTDLIAIRSFIPPPPPTKTTDVASTVRPRDHGATTTKREYRLAQKVRMANLAEWKLKKQKRTLEEKQAKLKGMKKKKKKKMKKEEKVKVPSEKEFSFSKGESLIGLQLQGKMWKGLNKFGKEGTFPSNYVEEKSMSGTHNCTIDPCKIWKASNPHTCLHEISETWKLDQCSAPGCGADLGPTRLAKENIKAQNAKDEDAAYVASRVAEMSASGRGQGGGGVNATEACHGGGEEKIDHAKERALARTVNAKSNETPEQTIHADRLSCLGISILALINFAFAHDCFGWTVSRVVRDIIKPATRDFRCRYGDLPEFRDLGMFGKATVFMSHCWNATFGDLIGAACDGGRMDRIVWIDIFAVRQWPGNAADLNFRGVIQRCKAMIVSISPVEDLMKFDSSNDGFYQRYPRLINPASKKILPFFRLWCVVEIASANENKKPIIIKGGKLIKRKDDMYEYQKKESEEKRKDISVMMRNLANQINLESAECAVPADYDREMIIIRQMDGGVKHLNSLVKIVLNDAAESIRYDLLEVDSAVCGEKELLLNMKIYSLSDKEEYKLAERVLDKAIAGGRWNIIHLLFKIWIERADTFKSQYTGAVRLTVTVLMRSVHIRNVVAYASAQGQTEILKMLLEVGVDGGGSSTRWTVCVEDSYLRAACRNGHLEVVKVLLNAPNKTTHNMSLDINGCVLHEACENGHLEVVKYLLNVRGIDINDEHGGGTSLRFACLNGHLQVVKVLLNAKDINVNKTSTRGGTPLGCAVLNGHLEVVKALLNANDIVVNTHLHFDGNSTLLNIAKENKYDEIVHLLQSAGATTSATCYG